MQTRVAIWLHPWDDPMGSAYQIVQSLFAFGYGGVFGTGYTSGFPRLIPEVHTDFIFAAIGEEFGLIGVTFLLLAYLFKIKTKESLKTLERIYYTLSKNANPRDQYL